MDHELAKQLKDVGFPQMSTGDGYFSEGESSFSLGEPYKSRSVYYPTLQELIEACGHGFRALLYEDPTGPWTALAMTDYKPLGVDLEELHKTQARGSGSSPSEAVARLWLALQCERLGHDMKSGLDDNTTPPWPYCRRCGHSEQTTIRR
jgi:hypothetical protein